MSTPEVVKAAMPAPAPKEPMKWADAVEEMRPHVVRLLTPNKSGTGFQFHRMTDQYVALATAAHVVDHAHAWGEPLRIVTSRDSVMLRNEDRAIFIDSKKDTAAIVIAASLADKLGLPTATLTLAPEERFLKVGNDIGWLGFPSVGDGQMCFFGGRVSAWNTDQYYYLVDGVAINGVSGGPAFHILGARMMVLMGILSAYIPNRATGEALPGLSVIRDVSHLHEMVKHFNSLAEAKAKETPPSEAAPASEAPKP